VWQAACPYDIATTLEIEVRFADIASMEGVYYSGPPPTIVVSSLRPAGRRAFTCGHELGHHVLGHGDQYDDFMDGRPPERWHAPEEFQAQCFSGALLMPKSAVLGGFARRECSPETCPPEAVYVVATWLGVGYGTLVNHLRHGFGAIDGSRERELLRHDPIDLRSSIIGEACHENLIVADMHWTDRAIDLEAGDRVILGPDVVIEGDVVEVLARETHRTVARARAPGLGRAFDGNWAAYVRVSRREFVGRAAYRFLEECDE
jgi:hypothetical protein